MVNRLFYGETYWAPNVTWFIEGADQNILIDTSMSAEDTKKYTETKAEDLISFEDALASVGRKPEDIDLLVDMGEAIKKGSLCGLGQTAPNPVLTTIRYFRDEYEAHINDKSCPALVCKALISYRIDPDKCKGCMICAKSCPTEAITGEKKQVHVIDQSECIRCGMCFEKCPKKFRAVECIAGELNEGGQ